MEFWLACLAAGASSGNCLRPPTTGQAVCQSSGKGANPGQGHQQKEKLENEQGRESELNISRNDSLQATRVNIAPASSQRTMKREETLSRILNNS